MTAGVTGSVTDWRRASPGPMRFAVQPTGVTGTASLVLERSKDGGATVEMSLGTLALISSDNGRDCYPRPDGIVIGQPLYRWRVANDGGGTHNIIEGA